MSPVASMGERFRLSLARAFRLPWIRSSCFWSWARKNASSSLRNGRAGLPLRIGIWIGAGGFGSGSVSAAAGFFLAMTSFTPFFEAAGFWAAGRRDGLGAGLRAAAGLAAFFFAGLRATAFRTAFRATGLDAWRAVCLAGRTVFLALFFGVFFF